MLRLLGVTASGVPPPRGVRPADAPSSPRWTPLRSPCVAVMLAVLSVGCSRRPLARLFEAEWTAGPWADLVGVTVTPNLDGVGGEPDVAGTSRTSREGRRWPDRRDGVRDGAGTSGDDAPGAPWSPTTTPPSSPWNAGKRGSGSSTPPLPGVRLAIVGAVSGVGTAEDFLPGRGVVCPPDGDGAGADPDPGPDPAPDGADAPLPPPEDDGCADDLLPDFLPDEA